MVPAPNLERKRFVSRVLVVLRHGESAANAAGRFTGWNDVPLTEAGRSQARSAAQMIHSAGLSPDVVFSSPLDRAVETARIVLAELGNPATALLIAWQLQERAYGELTGRLKTDVIRRFGAEQSFKWRRSLYASPPPLSADDPRHPRHAASGTGTMPEGLAALSSGTESLSDVVQRVRSWCETDLSQSLAGNGTVLVVGHGNSLRALSMVIDDLTADEVEALNIPTCQPLCWSLDKALRGHPKGGRWLDPQSAWAAAAAVSREGGT
jgi:2,3-bisphosphoglycerate-dependent phosphoglycerate mutase